MKDFTPKELEQHLKTNTPFMLDVREQWEWEKCHFEHSTLIPMADINFKIDSLDKEQETVIICHHGIRSMHVARYFESMGFTNIINLRGGVDAWAKQFDNSMALY